MAYLYPSSIHPDIPFSSQLGLPELCKHVYNSLQPKDGCVLCGKLCSVAVERICAFIFLSWEALELYVLGRFIEASCLGVARQCMSVR